MKWSESRFPGFRPGVLRWGRALLVCGLSISLVLPVYGSRTDIDSAKEKTVLLEEEKKKVESVLKNLEGLKTDTAAYVRQLDNTLEELGGELNSLLEQIAAKEADIEKTQSELAAAKEVEAAQYQAMKLRIKYMYERGNTSAVDLLLQAQDLTQLLNRAEYISKISEYDRKMMDQYAATKESIAAHEAVLKEEHAALLTLKEATEVKQASVTALLAEKNKELKNYEARIVKAEGQISEYEKDIRAQEERIKAIEAEIKRKEEEARKAAEEAGKQYNTASIGNIKFIWPVPSSSRITSGFGGRSSPTEGASSNHQGIDIGAPDGTAIVAAAAGEVIVSTYSYSAGNYIMINHGGGVYTVYMHCSQLLAAVGDQVAQGQTIAKVGSTGYSTGSHLHFGIRTGGKYVNPSNYVRP